MQEIFISLSQPDTTVRDMDPNNNTINNNDNNNNNVMPAEVKMGEDKGEIKSVPLNNDNQPINESRRRQAFGMNNVHMFNLNNNLMSARMPRMPTQAFGPAIGYGVMGGYVPGCEMMNTVDNFRTPLGPRAIPPHAPRTRRPRNPRLRPYTPYSPAMHNQAQLPQVARPPARPYHFPGHFPTPGRGTGTLSPFEIINAHRFGNPGRKAIVLGTVTKDDATYHLLNLTSFNRFTGQIGPGGIRLFAEQFVKILRNSANITEALKSVQRQEIVGSEILLGEGVYSYVCSDEPNLDIRYYRAASKRDLPTDIHINMNFQEWESFLEQGMGVLKDLQNMRRRILAAPVLGDREDFYRF